LLPNFKYLLDNGFINAIKKGRSHELTTTDKYADMFGLPKDIRQMKSVMITQLGLDERGISEPAEDSIHTVDSLPAEEDLPMDEDEHTDNILPLNESEEEE